LESLIVSLEETMQDHGEPKSGINRVRAALYEAMQLLSDLVNAMCDQRLHRDEAAAERTKLQTDSFRRVLSYWKKQLNTKKGSLIERENEMVRHLIENLSYMGC
jgi:hypothetical protein